MWCIGRMTEEYRERMYDLLELYTKPYDAAEPVICLDEKSKQLLEQTRRPLPGGPGQLAKEDYEYRRAGTPSTSQYQLKVDSMPMVAMRSL